jgi:hypothetical protein
VKGYMVYPAPAFTIYKNSKQHAGLLIFHIHHNFRWPLCAASAERVTGRKLLNRFPRSRLIDQLMKIKIFSLIAAASLVLSGVAFAGAKTYEVTGPVLEVTDSMIVVEKGAKKERWELDRDSNTKVTGDVKVGDKVHISYTMTAKDVEVKAAKGEKGTKKEKASPTASPTS